MKRTVLTIAFWGVFLLAGAQQRITLQECFDMAEQNHPKYAQKSLLAESAALQIENYKKDLLPQFFVNGKMSWQNEVIALPIDMPMLDIPELSKDQYRLSLDVNQTIYRGNIYSKQKELEALNQILLQLEVDKDFYYLKNNVKSLFFSIIILDEQKKIAESYQKQIEVKLKEFQAKQEEGVVLSSVLDGLRVEQLNVKQQLQEIKLSRASLLANLELLTKMELGGVQELSVGDISIDGQEQERIEYKYLTANQNKLEYSKQLIDAKKMPTLSAFATGGIGRPGFNALSDDFSEFLMVGLNLNWKVFNWNRFNNQKKILDLNIQIIETEKTDFELNVQMALNKMQKEIDKFENLLKDDPEMIRLRKNVADNASHQLDQGVITTSNYIDDLQKYHQAVINMKIHEVQLVNSKLDYLNVLGKL